MKDVIDPETGQLLDFIPRQGDPEGAFQGWHGKAGSRRRWGRRVLLSTPNSTGPLAPSNKVFQRALLVTTEDLGRTYPIQTVVRFAAPVPNVAEGSATTADPTTTYDPLAPFLTGAGAGAAFVRFTIRYTSDERTTPMQLTFDVSCSGPLVGGTALQDCVPFDIFEARHLSIEAEMLGTSPNLGVWVDCVSTVVDVAAQNDLVIGLPFAIQRFYACDIVNPALFLPLRFARRQFIIVNQSTTADLHLFFTSNLASISPVTPNLASIKLPAGGANTYESPLGGYIGPVAGLWYNGAADATAALVTEISQDGP